MSEPHTQYFDQIYNNKSPYEAVEIVRIRLSQAKLIELEFHELFKDVYEAKKEYMLRTREIASKHQNLENTLRQRMSEMQVLSEEELSNFRFDSIGEVERLWSVLINELKQESKASSDFHYLLRDEILSTLKEHSEIDADWNKARKLYAKQADLVANNDLSRGGIQDIKELFDTFEDVDYNHLMTLKQNVSKYQTAQSQFLKSYLKTCRADNEIIEDFRPQDEIDRFAQEASNYTFVTNTKNPEKSSHKIFSFHNSPSKETKNKRKSTIGSFGHRMTSTSTFFSNDLMNDEFSDSTNNANLKQKKSPGLIKSTVGSIFGKNKLKNKNSQSMTKIQDDPIVEVRSLNTNKFSSKDRHATTNSIRPDLFKKGSSQYKTRSRSSSKLKNSIDLRSDDQSEESPFVDAAESVDSPKDAKRPPYQSQTSMSTSPTQPTSSSSQTQAYLPPQSQASLPPQPSYQLQSTSSQPFHSNSPFASLSISQAPLMPQTKLRSAVTEPIFNTSNDGNVNNGPIRTSSNASLTPSQNNVTMTNTPFGMVPLTSSPNPPRPVSALFHQVTGEMQSLDAQTTGPIAPVTGQSLFQHELFEDNESGLSSSIAEVINVSFLEGIVLSSQLVGEIAFTYSKKSNTTTALPIGINLKIKNASKFDKVILNQAFMERVSAEEFKVNPQFVESRTLGAIKYSIKNTVPPIVILPVWNFEPHQASIILTIKMSPTLPFDLQQVVLENFAVYVSIDGANATSALSKPQGTFNKENKRITWKFPDPVKLQKTSELRMVARFMTDGIATEPEKGVSCKFTIRENTSESIKVGSALVLQAQESDEGNPFGGAWKSVPSTRSLATGTYFGKAA